jgi:RNA polymerase sigma-70 factor (ECF subfamily)
VLGSVVTKRNAEERPLGAVSSATVFATTHWSVVAAAGGRGTPEAAAALEALCRAYWYPLYGFVRRQGHNPEDAEDLTQQFFMLWP